jgi:acyl-CoA thioesterase
MTVYGSGPAPSPPAGGVPITDLFAVWEDGVSPAVMAAWGGGSRGFGGHVAAVALAAAYATVPQGLSIHHVHRRLRYGAPADVAAAACPAAGR